MCGTVLDDFFEADEQQLDDDYQAGNDDNNLTHVPNSFMIIMIIMNF